MDKILGIFLCLTVVFTAAAAQRSCPTNLVWNDCGLACNKTCREPNPICPERCEPRCECPEGAPILLNPRDPRNPPVCGQMTQCPDTDQCRYGRPHMDDSGMETMCGGIAGFQCPDGFDCIIADEYPDAAGVCCPDVPACPGDYVWNDCGSACNSTCRDPMPVCIEMCVQRCECPASSPILLNPSDRRNPPQCGDMNSCIANPCEHGYPLRDDDDEQVFCGRGPNRRDCPDDYECIIEPADRYAVCCSRDPPVPPPGGAAGMKVVVGLLVLPLTALLW